jgi:SWI/SNF-related matrix-associated actin-dependent regulator 1 of chromatin subfamily A
MTCERPTPFPYQVKDAEWLASKRHALLASEMRTGKTVSTVLACDLLDAQRILVICPAVARINWLREFGKFSTRSLPRIALFSSNEAPTSRGVNVTSYDLVGGYETQHLLGDTDAFTNLDVLVLDESQYLKSADAQRSQIILGRGGLVHRARHVWALSGTPAPNHYAELWPLLYVFGVYKGSYDEFVREFCTGFRGPYGFQITGSKNTMKLRELLSKVMLRRTMKEVRPEMPSIEFDDFVVSGTAKIENGEHAAFVNQAWVVANALTFNKELDTISAPTLRRYTGLAKVPAVVDLVKLRLDGGSKKIVLFAYHREVIEQLTERLMDESIATVPLYGQTSAQQREKNIRAFQEDSVVQVFIGQIVAAGTNIDLSVADEALFVEASWVPGENAQAAARLQNVNKNRPITATFVALADSIDERIQTTLRRKTKALTALFV